MSIQNTYNFHQIDCTCHIRKYISYSKLHPTYRTQSVVLMPINKRKLTIQHNILHIIFHTFMLIYAILFSMYVCCICMNNFQLNMENPEEKLKMHFDCGRVAFQIPLI